MNLDTAKRIDMGDVIHFQAARSVRKIAITDVMEDGVYGVLSSDDPYSPGRQIFLPFNMRDQIIKIYPKKKRRVNRA